MLVIAMYAMAIVPMIMFLVDVNAVAMLMDIMATPLSDIYTYMMLIPIK